MNRTHLATLLVGSLLALAPLDHAESVVLNSRGSGQVLLYPYYTVNGGNSTLISVVNTAEKGKALRVRMVEGENGRIVLGFNLYLGPFDVWTANITEDPETGGAQLATTDTSCSLPSIGSSKIAFKNFDYVDSSLDGGANRADPGTGELTRTREGTVEIYEMGTVVIGSTTASAIQIRTDSDGHSAPANCAGLASAWNPAGYWGQNPATDLINPTGGLIGSASIVNVSRGTALSYAAEALDDFRADPRDFPRGTTQSVVMHTLPATVPEHPLLSDAVTDPKHGVAVAHVIANGSVIEVSYSVPTRAIDAVSAVLMAGKLVNEFVTDPADGLATDWILSYPTRRFYTDPAIVGKSAIAPFSSVYSGTQKEATPEMIPVTLHDRDQHLTSICNFVFCPAPLTLFTPGTSVEVLNFLAPPDAVTEAVLGSPLVAAFASPEPYKSGWGTLYLDNSLAFVPDGTIEVPKRFLRPSIEGEQFAGFPVIGFMVQRATATSAQPTTIDSTVAIPHRTTTTCSSVRFVSKDATQPVCD